MEMPFDSWSCELEMDDPVIVRQRNNGLREATEEQLRALMNFQNKFVDDSYTLLTGYPINVKLPARVNHLGIIRPPGGLLGHERPSKQSKLNNSRDSLFLGPQEFSTTVSTPPSIYVPNSAEKLVVQHQQLQNHFTNLFKLKGNKSYYNVVPSIHEEMSLNGRHDQSCLSDMDAASNFFSGGFNPPKLHGPSDMRISNVTSENGNVQSRKKASGSNQDRIMAERKRRQKLSQRFIALSAILPGLNKMDKASVLGDAIKYVKQLQDKIKALEEQAAKNSVQSVVFLKNTEPCNDHQVDSDKIPSSTSNSSSDKDATEGVITPEIDTRVVNRNVLIHIHCEKRENLLVEFVAELEKLRLTVVNASILSFSETIFDMTFNAQMEEGCNLTVVLIVKALEALLMKST